MFLLLSQHHLSTIKFGQRPAEKENAWRIRIRLSPYFLKYPYRKESRISSRREPNIVLVGFFNAAIFRPEWFLS